MATFAVQGRATGRLHGIGACTGSGRRGLSGSRAAAVPACTRARGIGGLARVAPGAASLRAAAPAAGRRAAHSLRVVGMDAAQPFDYEARKLDELRRIEASKGKLRIGLVGFGNFGQFLAKRFINNGHTVLAVSRTDYSREADELGVDFYQDSNDFCEEHPEVVILCTSILSTEKVLLNLPLQRLKRNTLFVDVLSVKEFPKKLFQAALPPEFDILCLHPMFGPDSGAGSWEGLNLVYDKVRIGAEEGRMDRVDALLGHFVQEGCRMVEMTCEEHDRRAASSQFITHTVGRVLGHMELGDTTINTKGYDSLLNLVQNTANDSFDLYYGLFMYNENATGELERLEHAFDEVKKQLFDQLHDILRQQMFYNGGGAPGSAQEKDAMEGLRAQQKELELEKAALKEVMVKTLRDQEKLKLDIEKLEAMRRGEGSAAADHASNSH